MDYDMYSDDELREMLRSMIMRLGEEECGKIRRTTPQSATLTAPLTRGAKGRARLAREAMG